MQDEIKHQCCHIYCLSWAAILAGALVAIGLSFLFNLFGLSMGITAYTYSAEGSKTLIASGYIGMVVGVMISMFLAGWVSGYLGHAKCSSRKVGILYGFLAWCLALIISIFMTASMGRFIAVNQNLLNDNTFVSKLGHSIAQWTPPAADAENMRAPKAPEHNLPNLTGQETKVAVKSLFLTFLIFLAGAIMSAYGGYRGIKAKKDVACIDKPNP